mmetsp:Transcript_16931/g.31620  ORF Transcript_16931/g.31620 Transcript_16931/m.31620 type:complete len:353 (+) Transcript_16931:1050-2108(+)
MWVVGWWARHILRIDLALDNLLFDNLLLDAPESWRLWRFCAKFLFDHSLARRTAWWRHRWWYWAIAWRWIFLAELFLDLHEVGSRCKLPLEDLQQIVMPSQNPHRRFGVDTARECHDKLMVLLYFAPIHEPGLHCCQERGCRHLLLLRGHIREIICIDCSSGLFLPWCRHVERWCAARLLWWRLWCLLQLFCCLACLAHGPLLVPLPSRTRQICFILDRWQLFRHRRWSRCLFPRCNWRWCTLLSIGILLDEETWVRKGRGETCLWELVCLLVHVLQPCQALERPCGLWIFSSPMLAVFIGARAVGFLAKGMPVSIKLTVYTPASTIGWRVAQETCAFCHELFQLVQHSTWN